MQVDADGVPAGEGLRDVREGARGLGAVPPGADHQEPGVAGTLHQQAQDPEGGDIGPVQVVEDHHDRATVRDVDDGVHELLPDPEGGAAVVGKLGQVLTHTAQHLAPGPQRRCAVVLRAAPQQHGCPALTRPGRQLGRHPALADPGFSDQCHEGRRARVGAVQLPQDGRELGVAAHHRPRWQAGDQRLDRAEPHRRPPCARTAGRWGWGSRRRPTRRVPVQARVLSQHGRLQLAHFCAGFDPELVGEHLAHHAQGVQRLGLSAGTGQGQRPQRPQPLPQRVRGRQRLELPGYGAVVTELEGSHGPVLQGHEAQLLEPGPFGHRGRCVLEVEVGQPTPLGERRVELGDDVGQLLGSQPPAVLHPLRLPETTVCPAHRTVEPCGVEVAVADAQRVPRSHGDEHRRRRPGRPLRFEGATQSRDIRLQGAADSGRWPRRPEQVDEDIHRDRATVVHGERRHQGALLARPEVHGQVAQARLGCAEHTHSHPIEDRGADGGATPPFCAGRWPHPARSGRGAA